MTAPERAVCGIVLQEPRRLPEVDRLTEQHFTLGEHWQILAMLRDLRTWDVDLLVHESARRPETGGPGYVITLYQEYVGRESLRPHVDALEQGARDRAAAVRGVEAEVAPVWGPVTHAAVFPQLAGRLGHERGALVVPSWRVHAVRSGPDGTEVRVDGEWLPVDASVTDVTRRLRWTGGVEAERLIEHRPRTRSRWETTEEVEEVADVDS